MARSDTIRSDIKLQKSQTITQLQRFVTNLQNSFYHELFSCGYHRCSVLWFGYAYVKTLLAC